jgi:hypothetical protein
MNAQMRVLLPIIAALSVCFFGYIGWYFWDSSRNRGSEFGYYGEFNRVSNTLASIPGVVVTQAWHNLDLTLEEFGFDLTITGRPVRLFFGETDPIRNMRRDAAVAALQNRIAAELGLPQTNR